MRKSLQLQAEMTRGVRRLRVRRHARLRGRRPGRRRGRACGAGRGAGARWPAHEARVGGAGASGGPSRASSRTSPPSPARPARTPVPHHAAQGGVRAGRRARPARRSTRPAPSAAAAACADRVAGGGAPRLRHRRASARAVAQLRPDGFRLGARRRHSVRRAWASQGQFTHPLVVRAKLEIASACHAHGKVPSHCVVTEFKDTQRAARRGAQGRREFGYTRMWSIHPDQIRPILEAFAPSAHEIETAAK